MDDLTVEWYSEQPKFYDALEAALIDKNILFEGEIANYDDLKEFGLFSFLLYRFFFQRKYYLEKEMEYYLKKYELDMEEQYQLEKEQETAKKKGQLELYKFNLNILGLKGFSKTLFLLSTKKDKFSNPYLEELFIPDPLNYIPNGDMDPSKCVIYSLLNYNRVYLLQRGHDVDEIPHTLTEDLNDDGRVCGGCVQHRKDIRNWLANNPQFNHVLGGWAFPFDIDPNFISLESLEEVKMDSSFNYFLALYFKNKLGFDEFHSGSSLNQPFKSHEVDCCLIKEKTALVIETNVRVDNIEKDLKTKIYNLWSLNKVYEKIIMLYITFAEITPRSHIGTFIEFHDIDNHEKGSFEVINWPKIFKNIDDNLGDITKDNLSEEFDKFLESLENKIQDIINF
jgi:hypothetical protein